MDKDKLIARRVELVRIVEAIDGVIHSKEWQVLREEFEERVENLERQLLTEAKSPKLEVEKIHFLQGQIAEVRRFDLPLWADKLKKELEGIKLRLNQ